MSAKETPLARQYRQIKEKHPDTILLFRLGDFYETFGDDAIATAAACGITLTKRNNGAAGETPLAGFPHHQLDNYLPKLVRSGYRVAVCEQLEDPKQAKGIVKRGVVEVVTPGVVMYDKLLENSANTFLCALVPLASKANGKTIAVWGIAFADVSTGVFMAADVPDGGVLSLLESYAPAEVLVNKEQKEIWEPVLRAATPRAAVSKLESWLFDTEFARTTVLRHFSITSVKGFGLTDDSPAMIAAGMILHYIAETQRRSLTHITTLRTINTSDVMVLDTATRRNLEIHQPGSPGERQGALIDLMDRTRTPMGARLLRRWMQAPLINKDAIVQRQHAVEQLLNGSRHLHNLGDLFAQVGDIERLIARVVTDRATARDLVALRNGLRVIPDIMQMLSPFPSLHYVCADIHDHSSVVHMISAALSDAAPVQFGSGKMFNAGFSAELDSVCDAMAHGKEWIKEFQDRERADTGIPTLKVSFNNVFGYYIEVSKAQRDSAPAHYERRQTLANAERFTTPELKKLEATLLSAEGRVSELEQQLLLELKRGVAANCAAIQQTALAVATADCLHSYARTAQEYEYVQPELHTGTLLNIQGARHPVIERLLPAGTRYVPNNIVLDTETHQLMVLTGPNMSGKSSYLRQAGLIVFLAHIGSFVPAVQATIPITDRIFTRVGAQDNLLAGESTFLVEMQESANIVHNATSRSLILLDEVGRGTATFDGISIAWAIAEYLHEVVGAKTLFATHYHELTALAERFERIHNVKVEVVEQEGGLVFTHRVVPGSADHSFGIHVARMAGMPPAILRTAEVVLNQLETGKHDPARSAHTSAVDRRMLESAGQLTMFEIRDDQLRKRVQDLDVNALTPLQALQTLADLKDSLRDE